MNFKRWIKENWSYPGMQVPDWSPDLEYRLMTDVEVGHGFDVKGGGVLVPYCVVAYVPPHKDRFGVNEVDLKEIYPICTFSWDEENPIEYGLNDDQQGIAYAKKIWSSKFNAYHLLDKPTKGKIYVYCWEKAEDWLQDARLDVELHPTDPDYDDN